MGLEERGDSVPLCIHAEAVHALLGRGDADVRNDGVLHLTVYGGGNEAVHDQKVRLVPLSVCGLWGRFESIPANVCGS